MKRDLESQDYTAEFEDEFIRRAFISKVYTIVMFQLLLSFGLVALFVYVEDAQEVMHEHPEFYWISLGGMIITMLSMVCCESVRRTTPTNYITLFLFTTFMGFLMACSAVRFEPELVLMAVGITAVVTIVLTIFAMQTAIDFTVCGGVLFAGIVVLIIFGIVTIFIPGKTMILIYACGGALLFSFYLIYDTQMMMGGNHTYSISPEEYIFAALSIYIDIINLFLFILTILGITGDS